MTSGGSPAETASNDSSRSIERCVPRSLLQAFVHDAGSSQNSGILVGSSSFDRISLSAWWNFCSRCAITFLAGPTALQCGRDALVDKGSAALEQMQSVGVEPPTLRFRRSGSLRKASVRTKSSREGPIHRHVLRCCQVTDPSNRGVPESPCVSDRLDPSKL